MKKQTNRGISMLEVVVSLALVSSVLIVSLSASSRLIAHRWASYDDYQASLLAGRFLDEVTSLCFRDPDTDADVAWGIEAGENAADRALDDIDDYNGWSQVSPTFRDGQSMDGFQNWIVRIDVERQQLFESGIQTTSDDQAPLRLIRVTIQSPVGHSTEFRSLVSELISDTEGFESIDRMRHTRFQFSGGHVIDVVVPHRNRPLASLSDIQ